MRELFGSVLMVVSMVACGGGAPGEASAPGASAPPPVDVVPSGEGMDPAACEAQGGQVIGDIGDGATQRPDYVCEGGKAPLGRVKQGIEGSVCCPR